MSTKLLRVFLVLLMPFVAGLSGAAEVTDIGPDQLQALQAKQALIVDVRTEKEWDETGVIPGSTTLQFYDAEGKYDADAWLQQLRAQQIASAQPIVLVCRSGHRSKRVAQFLAQQVNRDHVYNLQGGIQGWMQGGGQTEKPCRSQMSCKK